MFLRKKSDEIESGGDDVWKLSRRKVNVARIFRIISTLRGTPKSLLFCLINMYVSFIYVLNNIISYVLCMHVLAIEVWLNVCTFHGNPASNRQPADSVGVFPMSKPRRRPSSRSVLVVRSSKCGSSTNRVTMMRNVFCFFAFVLVGKFHLSNTAQLSFFCLYWALNKSRGFRHPKQYFLSWHLIAKQPRSKTHHYICENTSRTNRNTRDRRQRFVLHPNRRLQKQQQSKQRFSASFQQKLHRPH